MKATVEREEVFSLKVGNLTVRGLRVESHWEGFTKLVTTDKQQVVVHGLKKPGLGGAFLELFGDVFGVPADGGVTILTASPDLLSDLLVAKKEAAAADLDDGPGGTAT